MNNFKKVSVLLLAGGDSTRFWPFDNKHFTHFLGKPLVLYCINQLNKYGFNEIIIIVNDHNKKYFINLLNHYKLINIKLIDQNVNLGIAGAILSSEKYISGKPLLVINPTDVYEDIIFYKLNKLLSTNIECVLSGKNINTYFPGGYLTADKADNITSITEKPSSKELPSNLVTFVFDYFKKSDLLLNSINKTNSKQDDIFEKAIAKMIFEGTKIKLLRYEGYWGYLKYPWHILNLSNYFLNRLQKTNLNNSFVSKSAKLSGYVHLEKGVKILDNVNIIGPCYIGKDTIIGNNCLVRESMIGNNCVVGFGSEIARSYIGNECWFHSNYIGDSVLYNNVGIGAGTVLANFRLDENIIRSKVHNQDINTDKIKLGSMIGKGVRLGVNVSVMPGIKIGNNSLIGAGVVLSRDLKDNQYCYQSFKNLVIKTNNIIISKDNRAMIKNTLKLS